MYLNIGMFWLSFIFLFKIMIWVSIYHKIIENSINDALDKRPRYLRWIPKKYYVKHFLEMHQYPDNKSDTFSISYKIYDKIRKKYV